MMNDPFDWDKSCPEYAEPALSPDPHVRSGQINRMVGGAR